MTAEVIQPPRMASFTKDNTSSASVYTHEAHNRFFMGDFIYQPNAVSSKRSSVPSSNHSKDKSNKISAGTKTSPKTFTVNRKNSYRGPNYYKINNRPISHPAKTPIRSKRISKFNEKTQIDPVFNLFPEKSLLEQPTFMVQYFTKALDLVKQNPDIHYKVLRAEIKVEEDTSLQETRDALQKQSKARKYQSLPVIGASSKNVPLETKNSQRNSAPVRLVYKPTDMSISEYLNTPLDIYQHKKKISDISNSDKSRETKPSHPSTESGVSVDTTVLYPMQLGKDKSKRYSLATKRNNQIIRRRSIVRKESDDLHEFVGESSPLKVRESLAFRREKLINKYGTPVVKNPNVGKVGWAEFPPSTKRHSDTGDVSIATGEDIYNDVKFDVFSKRLKDWNAVKEYLDEEHPSVSDNSYFLCRLMNEIYLRRILSARIALKLGSDKANLGVHDTTWVGLKESISATYGEENANFFEHQTKAAEDD